MFVRTALFLAFLGLATSAALASPKVYKGDEARALRCAQLVFWVAEEGRRLGYISDEDGVGIHAYGLFLLDRYITGTPQQKAAALGQLVKGTDDATSLQKFVTQHRSCTRRFPI